MENDIDTFKDVERFGSKRRRKRHLHRVLVTLSAVVVFCTVYALILPAITMEKTPTCGLMEHQHDESCYTLPTELRLCCPVAAGASESPVLHVHDQQCYDETGVLVCPLPELTAHVHDESCYEISQTEEAHTHTDACYSMECGELICGKGHVHTEDCYEETASFVCGFLEQMEHSHTENCFDPDGVLVCGMVEQAEHTHTEQCVISQRSLCCEIPEDTEHQHEEACYTYHQVLTCGQEKSTGEPAEPALVCQFPQLEPHTHTDGCRSESGELICGKQEIHVHVHGELCFTEAALSEEPTLICGMEEHIHDEVLCYIDPSADVECAEDWEASLPEKLTGQWARDFLAVAESQLGYRESETNLIVDANGTIRGYSRYGAWYGDHYGDWCAMFLSFCLHYAQIPEDAVPQAASCPAWIASLREEYGLYREACTYTPVPGDLVFFDIDGNGDGDHVGVVAELPEADGQAPKLKTIEGNSDNRVQYKTYDLDCPEILGYGQLPKNPALKEPLKLDGAKLNGFTPGKYGNYTLSYNETTDALIKDGAYANYYNTNSPLGTAGSFHLVGFDTVTLRAHTNGNVLANTLVAGSNFGTNNYTYELSYAVHYDSINPTSASATTGHILVLGSEHTVTLGGNNDQILINGTKIDKPYTIILDRDSQQNPFVNLERVRSEVAGISARLATVSGGGLEYDLTTDQNNRYITLLDPTGVGYFNITAGELNNYSNNPIRLMGFSEGLNGTMVINVDCAGVKQINLPVACIYVDGKEQATSEVVEFSTGKVIWNFSNAQGATINTNRMTGMIVALGATVNINQNLNGTVVAENINVNAESHRTDFTGTVDAPKVETTGIAVRKVDSDNISVFLPDASFRLERWDASSGSYVAEQKYDGMLTTDSDGCLVIDELTYNTAYRLWETKAPKGYTRNEEPYLFCISSKDTLLYPECKPDGFAGTAYATGSVLYYRNEKRDASQPELTAITVQKQWFDTDSNPTEGTEKGITIVLWQKVYSDEDRTQFLQEARYTTLTLQAPQWSAMAEDLPLNGTETIGGSEMAVYYAYYAVEQTVNGYTVSYENNDGITEGTILVRNTKEKVIYTLPETGGGGIWMYTTGGLLLMAAALLGYIREQRRKGDPTPS